MNSKSIGLGRKKILRIVCIKSCAAFWLYFTFKYYKDLNVRKAISLAGIEIATNPPLFFVFNVFRFPLR